ncbi:hypothetical protein GCM10008119_15930 [Pedobacter mendelii]|uniref:Uncharacterized protein n=1 Tax=Pedobacter mendelii TaxID=1908240 RepID=A0ABQ2BI66_9SPHI|nr:hypothetical protein GCM10008119_15930 [Pedobacter mendelii]
MQLLTLKKINKKYVMSNRMSIAKKIKRQNILRKIQMFLKMKLLFDQKILMSWVILDMRLFRTIV